MWGVDRCEVNMALGGKYIPGAYYNSGSEASTLISSGVHR